MANTSKPEVDYAAMHVYLKGHYYTSASLTRTDSTLSDTQNSPFLRLPGEIRNEIYHYVLWQDRYEFFHSAKRLTCGCKNRLAISSTCHQIFEETVLLPFTLNEFCFWSFHHFLDFYARLNTEKLEAIRRLRLFTLISNDKRKLWQADQRLEDGLQPLSAMLPGLQYISISVNSSELTEVEETIDSSGERRKVKRMAFKDERMEKFVNSGWKEHVKVELSSVKCWNSQTPYGWT